MTETHAEITEPSDTASLVCIILNANRETKTLRLPEGIWNVYVKGKLAGTEVLERITEGIVTVEPISAMVLIKE
jgi:hypothetical protein